MKKILLISFALLMATISCTDDSCFCNSGPFYADMKVKLTINDENPEVFLTVFEGNFEGGNLRGNFERILRGNFA